MAVEKVEYDKKEGRWIRVLVALGGTEQCWVGIAYGVAGPCATKERVEHSTGVVENWGETIRGGREDTPNCIWMSDSNFIRDGAIDRKKREQGIWKYASEGEGSEDLYQQFISSLGLVDMRVFWSLIWC